jgi:peptide/nickel transport system substrate-binding protein
LDQEKKWPKITEWPKIVKVLSLKEKLFFFFLLLFFIGSSGFWGIHYYYSKTKAIPTYGGEYIEGIIGQPLHINPVLSDSNETDADLSRLVYSGLFKYNGRGELIPDLAENYDISEDKLTYTVHLKKNVTWHDDETFSADDILFTVNLLSDPAYKSPLRGNWQGIETNALDDYTLEFKIKTPYVGFLNNLTFGILPKHVWDSVPAGNFSLSSLNLKPIGTGPYKYSTIQKDSNDNILSYKLISNPNYFLGKPFISKITFNFYTDEESALSALNRKEIMGISSISPEKISDITIQKSVSVDKLEIPRYFAIFFNQTKSLAVASDEVRSALASATNRREIIDQVLSGQGEEVFSPFQKNMIGYSQDLDNSEFNLDKANEILDQNGWTRGEDGMRGKNGMGLEINLITTDWSELVKTAEVLKSQWEKAGVKVNLNSYSISDVQENYIRPREYDALLFGQIVGADPDPYSFWHSNQKKDPGLNLSLFDDSEADKLIENARVEFDAGKRAQDYMDFQKILTKEIPAIFLYSPDYIYPISRKIQGTDIKTLISADDRFSEINNWYIKTQRIKK